MEKFVVVVLAAFAVLNSAAAETPRSLAGRRSDSTLISPINHSPPQAMWRDINLEVPRRRNPMDEAAVYISSLVDTVAISPSGSGNPSDLKIRPWVSGRNGLGVKVELSW